MDAEARGRGESGVEQGARPAGQEPEAEQTGIELLVGVDEKPQADGR